MDQPVPAASVSVRAVGDAEPSAESPEPDVVVQAPVVGSQTTVDPVELPADPAPPFPAAVPEEPADPAPAFAADDEPAAAPGEPLSGVETVAAPPVP